jgi:hypothetical protein
MVAIGLIEIIASLWIYLIGVAVVFWTSGFGLSNAAPNLLAAIGFFL